MENLWSQQRQQNDHLPNSSDGHPIAQWQNPTWSEMIALQGCSCLWCSASRRGDAHAGRTTEYQDMWLPGGGDPGMNRDLGVVNPTGIAPIVNDHWQTQAPFVVPHALNQENEALVISVGEGLRRLAGRYVNNPESLINTVRLEPSPSGRLQVVIVIDIDDIL